MELHREVRKLLKDIDAWRARHDVPETTFGVLAMNNGHLIPRMRAGTMPRLDTIKRVRKFLRNGHK